MCPKCKFEFELTEVMSAQLAGQIRSELEAELLPRRQQLDRQVEELKKQQAALDQAREGIDEQVRQRLDAERDKLATEAKKKAAEDVAVELKDRDERLKEINEKLKQAQDRDLAWRKREREIQDRETDLTRRQEEMAEQVKRQLADERAKLMDEGRQKAARDFAGTLEDRERRIKECEDQLATAKTAEETLRKREQELVGIEKNLQQQRESLDQEVKAELARQRDQLLEQARQTAREEAAVEIKDRDTQVADLRAKLKTSSEQELALRQKTRDLEEREEQLKLEVARTLDAERDKLREDARRKADEEHELALKQKEVQLDQMRRQIDELKRKAEQSSQQLQGEAQELVLEDLLRERFPGDEIEEVGKGIKGGDALQRICASGVECGTILWESKRTKTWSDAWLGKLRDDQRKAKADMAVIVTAVMPAGVDHFCHRDGVWVCSWSCATAVAQALRAGMLEVGKVRRALEGQHGKMEQVYNYLVGSEFRNRMAGIIEAFVNMRGDLDSERRAIEKCWAKREKQIERAMLSTAGMYGDFQGIIGGTLPEIEGMSLLQLEAN
jgi:hypothetical protein